VLCVCVCARGFKGLSKAEVVGGLNFLDSGLECHGCVEPRKALF